MNSIKKYVVSLTKLQQFKNIVGHPNQEAKKKQNDTKFKQKNYTLLVGWQSYIAVDTKLAKQGTILYNTLHIGAGDRHDEMCILCAHTNKHVYTYSYHCVNI